MLSRARKYKMSCYTDTTDETSTFVELSESPKMARQYAFTFFGQEGEELIFPYQPEYMSYMIYQHERCPRTGRHHLQGYFQCHKPKRAAPIIKEFKGLYLKKAFASPSANIAYCSKDESRHPDYPEIFQFGKVKGITEVKSIEDVAEQIKKGSTYSDLLKDDEVPPILLMRNRKYILPFEADLHRNVVRDVEVTFISGGTRFGKTHLAWSQVQCPDDVYQPVLQEGQPLWFDNYNGQDVLLLNDITPVTISRAMLLNICDKWPMPIPVKGARTNAKWTKVIITTNVDLSSWIEEFQRRVHNHAHFDEYKKFHIERGRIIKAFGETSIVYLS